MRMSGGPPIRAVPRGMNGSIPHTNKHVLASTESELLFPEHPLTALTTYLWLKLNRSLFAGELSPPAS